MTEVTQTQTLEQTLNKTDLGHLIFEHRKSFFAAVITVLIVVTGYYLWKEKQLSSAQNISLKVFEFQKDVWSEVKSGKIAPTELVTKFTELSKEVQSAPIMLPLALEMSKTLYEKGSLVEAEALLSKISGAHKHPMAQFFVGMQRSVVLEKLGKIDEAIMELETLVAIKDGFMPAKSSLELGRLYMVKAEKGKAQTQFEFVINTYPNDPEAKMAKLYLSELGK